MSVFSIDGAAILAEASYQSKRITKPKLLKSCPHEDVQAHVLDGDILLLPGSNSLQDYLLYNLRPLRLGRQKYRMDDETTAKGASGTIWHQGFLAYSVVVFEWLKDIKVRPKFIIGHSLGAAATQILTKSYGVPGIGFAAPRTKANRGPVKNHEKCLIINRVDDIVPKVPSSFVHMGVVKELKVESNRKFTAHSMKHYRKIVKAALAHKVIPQNWSGG